MERIAPIRVVLPPADTCGVPMPETVEKYKLEQLLDQVELLWKYMKNAPVIHTKLRKADGSYGKDLETRQVQVPEWEVERLKAALVRYGRKLGDEA